MARGFPRVWAVVLACAYAAGIVYAVVPDTTWTRLLLFCLPIGTAAAAAWIRVARMTTRRAPWLVLAVSITLFFVGEMIWWVYLVRGQDPYPSPADAVFLAAYLPLAVTSYLLTRDTEDPDRSSWLDAGVIALTAALTMWVVLVEPLTAESTEPMVARLFTLAYPVCDLLVITLVLRMVLQRGMRTPATMAFAVGVAIMLAGDLSFSWTDLHGVYESARWVDTLWVVGYVTFGAAALYRGADEEPEEIPESSGLERLRVAGVMLAAIVPVAVMTSTLVERGLLGANTATATLVVTAAVMTLVFLRLWGLMRRVRRSAQRQGEERLAALVGHSSDGVLLVDDRHTITYASASVERLWGVPAPEVVGTPLVGLIGDDGVDAMRPVWVVAGDAPTTPIAVEMNHTAPTGERVHLEGTLCNLTGNPAVGAHVLTLRDVTERHTLQEELRHRAFQDGLTGLANRSLFVDRVQHAIDGWRRKGRPTTAVVFIDLDDFKSVNDGIGHGAGDELLSAVAARLASSVRRGDSVARLGGDEFGLLLEDLSDPESAVVQAERVLQVLREPIAVAGMEMTVEASAGVAFVEDDSTVESLLRDADIAMYGAKGNGKAHVAVFDQLLLQAAYRRLDLKIALPEALRDDQFTLAYQPILDGTLGRMWGAEALLRWEHPTLGVVSPAELIPNAEDSGLIVDIGRWVLHEACRQASEWNRRCGTPIAINLNVSVVQLRDDRLVEDVAAALAATGIDPGLVTLEITESVLASSERCHSTLLALRALGVRLAIDDFGTGYSSLAYLHRLPVDCLKIDRGFVATIDDEGGRSLIHTIVTLARSLGLSTVAEGVETAAQHEALISLGCDRLQGYHLGRPQPATEIEALLPPPATPTPDAATPDRV